MQDIKCISSVAEIGSLGHTLTGNSSMIIGINIPMIMVGKYD